MDVYKLTLPQLREELSRRGQSDAGGKSDLVARLEALMLDEHFAIYEESLHHEHDVPQHRVPDDLPQSRISDLSPHRVPDDDMSQHREPDDISQHSIPDDEYQQDVPSYVSQYQVVDEYQPHSMPTEESQSQNKPESEIQPHDSASQIGSHRSRHSRASKGSKTSSVSSAIREARVRQAKAEARLEYIKKENEVKMYQIKRQQQAEQEAIFRMQQAEQDAALRKMEDDNELALLQTEKEIAEAKAEQDILSLYHDGSKVSSIWSPPKPSHEKMLKLPQTLFSHSRPFVPAESEEVVKPKKVSQFQAKPRAVSPPKQVTHSMASQISDVIPKLPKSTVVKKPFVPSVSAPEFVPSVVPVHTQTAVPPVVTLVQTQSFAPLSVPPVLSQSVIPPVKPTVHDALSLPAFVPASISYPVRTMSSMPVQPAILPQPAMSTRRQPPYRHYSDRQVPPHMGRAADNSQFVGQHVPYHMTGYTPQAVTNMPQGMMNHQQLVNVLSLPKPELTKFNGDPMAYHMFINSFNSCVDSTEASAAVKLSKLMELCKGEALEVIKSCACMTPEEGYETAMYRLRERFGNKYVISETWLKTIIKGPHIRADDAKALQRFVDDLRTCTAALESMNLLKEIDCRVRLVEIVKRLPAYLQTRWRKKAVAYYKATGDYPPISDFVDFMDTIVSEVCDPVFGVNPSKGKDSQAQKSKNFQVSATSGSKKCVMCSGPHDLHQCAKFKKNTAAEKLKFVKSKRLCFNCLKGPGHTSKFCKANLKCQHDGCNKKHSSLLHSALNQVESPVELKVEPVTTQPKDTSAQQSTSTTALTCKATNTKVALLTVPVCVSSQESGISVKTLALLDSGSTHTFCSKRLQQMLAVPGKPGKLDITTLSDGKETDVREFSLSIRGLEESKTLEFPRVHSIQHFPTLSAGCMFRQDISSYDHLKDLPMYEGEVTLLIGMDNVECMLPLEVRKGKPGQPVGIRTKIGWALGGPVESATESSIMCNFTYSSARDHITPDMMLSHQVEQFWKLDAYGSNDENTELSLDDRRVIKLWDSSVKLSDNHFQLDIPFKKETPDLPNSRPMAEKRLQYLGKRLKRDDKLREKYTKGIHDMLAKGYAERAEDVSTPGQVWYIPHHPVVNVNKPDKLRIVFDCGAQFKNTSLNKEVLQGPDLANKLIGVLLRFREHQIGVMADIEAMFYQVKVTPKHRDVLRFLWWRDDDPEKPIDTFRMTVHIFGGIWSSSVSNYALRRTAEDHRDQISPAVYDTVMNSFYVDDLLRSVSTVQEGKSLIKDVVDLLSKRGFNLTKWTSNNKKVLSSIPKAHQAEGVQNLDITKDSLPVERALGVVWDTEQDVFSVKVKQQLQEPPFTKRKLLSIVSSIYDPLGMVCPFVLTAKMLFQESCKMQAGWDDILEESITSRLLKWIQSLEDLRDVKVPRWVIPCLTLDYDSVQLHHFCDASQDAYGTVSFVRWVDMNGRAHFSFVFGKSRLCPLKQVSIPRLELCAAVMAVRVNNMLQREMTVKIQETFYWTDSTTVLYYINSKNRRFQTFVANRVSVIHEFSSVEQWHHISSKNNPADAASRGLKPEHIESQWLQGAQFLDQDESQWPKSEFSITDVNESKLELKKVTASCTTVMSDNPTDKLLNYYSDILKLKKGVAWFMKFFEWLKSKRNNIDSDLKPEDLSLAESNVIRYLQCKWFPTEFADLTSKGKVRKTSVLYKLEPFVDDEGIIRVGGRLKHAVVPIENKHQVVLPKDAHLTHLVVKYFHEVQAKHCGVEYVLSLLREKYWIIGARSLIKKILRACILCKRLRGKLMTQQMAVLPKDRMDFSKPIFANVGIDCFGPFFVKRGRSQEKRYGCIFTCLTFRAIHLEVLFSLDASSFLNALQRFICRRGTPDIIRTDNGTNFVGGSREWFKLMQNWNKDNKVRADLQHKQIQWLFNPPSASHMGGVWERMIRSVRNVLNALLYNTVLNDENLSTFMCEVEHVVNNRPMTPCSDSPHDVSPLRPSHLMLLRPIGKLPADSFTPQDAYRKGWRHVQHLADCFWSRWLKEYLPIIQRRQKWLHPQRNLKVDDVVIICDENSPRNHWPLARVLKVNQGNDGRVRSAVVKTSSSEFTRPITKLCLLEISD